MPLIKEFLPSSIGPSWTTLQLITTDYKTALLTLPPSNQLTRDSMHHIYSHHSLQDHKLRSAWAEVGGRIASDVKDESVCVLSVRSISAVCLQWQLDRIQSALLSSSVVPQQHMEPNWLHNQPNPQGPLKSLCCSIVQTLKVHGKRFWTQMFLHRDTKIVHAKFYSLTHSLGFKHLYCGCHSCHMTVA